MACALLHMRERDRHLSILSRNCSSMKKVQKLSKNFAPELGSSDFPFPIETVAESDGRRPVLQFKTQSLGMCTRAPSETASEDSCTLKRKSMSLNADILRETLSSGATFYTLYSKNLSSDEKKRLRKRLKLELEQVRSLYYRLEAKELQIRGLFQSEIAQENHSDANGPGVENSESALKILPESLTLTPFLVQREAWISRQPTLLIPDQEMTESGSKEKRTPKANQLYVNSEFVWGKGKVPNLEKPKAKAPLMKRNLQGNTDVLDQKRQKADTGYNKKVAEVMRQCGTILRKLMSHRHGWVFNEPVDVVKLGLHDYFQIIKKPMDLGTIKAKLESDKYSFPLEFAEDVRLTFTNAATYNPPGHDVHAMADLLMKIFEERWRSVEEKLKDIRVSGDSIVQDVQDLQVTKDLRTDHANPHQAIVGDSHPTLAYKRSRAAQRPKNDQPKPKADKLPKRPMSFDEKQELSKNLESLSADKLERIVQIIKSKDPNLRQTDDEIEVDIDSFDTRTLWELHRFVLTCNKNKGKAKKGNQKMQDGKPPHSEMITASKVIRRGNDGGEEEVDIGDDMPSTSYPPVVIDKDGCGSKYSSSNSSSSESGSSSDSDSGSSSAGSDFDAADDTQSADASKVSPRKEPMGSGTSCGQRCSPALEIEGAKRSISDIDEEHALMKTAILDPADRQEGEIALHEQQVSPEKLLRAALLKNRFADTILKAQEKTMPSLNKAIRSDPEKLKKEREDLERRQKEEKARLQAEAKAAEIARKKAEADAAAEARRKREAEREAARLALQKMEKTVEIDENCEILKDLERLRTAHPEHVPSSGDETSPVHSPNVLPAFAFEGGNPLEQLGLFMKDDEDEEEERENLTLCREGNNVVGSASEEDEEGEIED